MRLAGVLRCVFSGLGIGGEMAGSVLSLVMMKPAARAASTESFGRGAEIWAMMACLRRVAVSSESSDGGGGGGRAFGREASGQRGGLRASSEAGAGVRVAYQACVRA